MYLPVGTVTRATPMWMAAFRKRTVRPPARPLMRRACELRRTVTTHDAAYVALAERLGWTLLTADGRLSRAPGIRCRAEIIRP